MTLISIVAPLYNEAENLRPLYERIKKVFENTEYEFEFIPVESGSVDRSLEIARQLHAEDPRVKVLSLSRDFGHQVSLSAGVDHARGVAVILMDCDLQHPPEIIPRLLEKWREGYPSVYTVRKIDGRMPVLQRYFSALFYRIFSFLTKLDLPANSADFRLLDRKVVLELRKMPERNRFLRGLIYWTGFKSAAVEYREDPRHAGERKYHFTKRLFLAVDAITSFSTVPLYIGVIIGTGFAFFGFAYFIYVLYVIFILHVSVPGWASLISLLAILGGILLMVMGLVGIYVGKIFEEVKGRPLYLVNEIKGFERC